VLTFVYHCFRPGDTIDAIIKLKGRHDLTPEEMIPLRQAFNELNGMIVVHPGTTCKIPLSARPASAAPSSGPAGF
jgi:hypothetical protein